MVTPPQTALDVLAAGIDLAADELQQICDVTGIFLWLGSCDSVRTALIRVLGGGQSRLRDLVNVLADLWQATVRDLWVPQGETKRDLNTLKVGYIAMVQRIARLRLCLTAQDEAAAAAQAVDWGLAVPVENVGAGSAAAQATTAEPRFKLSVLLDPALGSELVRRPQAEVREMYTTCVKPPRTSSRPWSKSALSTKSVAVELVPFVAFALFGPHDKRLLRKLTYLNLTFMANGCWQRKEPPGPPSFEY